ncbi:hypothetical protein OIDMADRAFT_37297 [Oidiodendron maius Zn]|uniref:phosphoserine transaminase n=1 Tax=Oidiodendron maius (strain Zn) TaxID=913774 RepID=A0A0C3D9H6_OIDMZ|nr:hypothetical protein OIDMADRAFT_37297 [Oidiodendron maius Zn]
MPSGSDITCFGAGPALLPTEILNDAAKALINYNDTGLGIAEHSHRSKIATAIINEAKADLAWSQKAAAEAERLFGLEHVNIAADGKFETIPNESTWNLSQGSAPSLEPGPDQPIVVADMSSNILSRKIPVKNFSAIFFGTQKNLGLTGITVVIIEKSFLMQPSATLIRQLALPIPPRILEYETIAKNNSLYNTLSIFDVYIAGQVLKRLLQQHPNKVQAQQAISKEKARLIYGALEAYPDIYKIIPDKTVRSRMNICFRINGGNAAEEAFLEEGAALVLLV